MIDALERLVRQLEDEPSLVEPDRLRERLEALDRLEAYLPDSRADTPEPGFGAGSIEAGLYRRAREICRSLEAVNCELYEAIRSEIQRGERPETLLRWIDSSSETEEASGPVGGMGYDYLDELVSEVFQFEEPDGGGVRREAEMVFYQPTPARHIFSLMGLTALDENDVLVDLGSGLGHVPLLVSACTRALSIGIEREASYVERARECAHRLNLDRVKFLQQDARTADLSVGTVFYLYTPFVGSILDDVLERLRLKAAARPIRICTYGACTSVVAEEPWLEADVKPETDRIALFRSRD